MSTEFSSLSREGKLAKLGQHLGSDHPVPSEWVRWLAGEFVPAGDWPAVPGRIDRAFHELDDVQKLEKLACSLEDGPVPSPWVEWLMETYVDRRPDVVASAAAF